jgi:hypothetical protein
MKKLRHIKKDTLERIALLVTIVGFPLVLISTLGVFYQLREVEKIAASSNNIALSTLFFRDSNFAIINAIESSTADHKTPILKDAGGDSNIAQLDGYLGDFETIEQAYSEGLLTDDELCRSFSYYVTATANNEEVQKYLVANPSFFDGLKRLQIAVTNTKNKECH